jgi:uncharacterized protein YcbK (DUF882 family)
MSWLLQTVLAIGGAFAFFANVSSATPHSWLEMTNTHTGEVVRVIFRTDKGYDETALAQLRHVLRDQRRDAAHRDGAGQAHDAHAPDDSSHPMDPALYDLLYDLAQSVGREPRYEIISGYRSAQSNAALRARSTDSGVAEHSLHMQGKAIDIRLKNYPTLALRAAALQLARGGVGYYDRSNFVHVDTGSVRRWEGH